MEIPFIIFFSKLTSFISKITKRGSGSTWPGHLALKADKNFIPDIIKKNPNLKIILVAGTNGKTTTSKLIQFIFKKSGINTFHNESGANLLNGIASSLIKHSSLLGKLNFEVAIFETDENTLPSLLKLVKTPYALVVLNLFRDQLDRYGEVNLIAKKWEEALRKLPEDTTLFINADDPQLSFIGKGLKNKKYFFGIDEKLMKKKELAHDSDFSYCPNCRSRLNFEKISYSHLGKYSCPKCGFENPRKITLPALPQKMLGIYNVYNVNVASLISSILGVENNKIRDSLLEFDPAFGRQESLSYKGKDITILLSKNPTGFNQSIEAIFEISKKPNVLLVLNDRIPDGRDVSWIWDIDTEYLVNNNSNLFIAGDRVFDMGLRIKYCLEKSELSSSKYHVFEKLKDAIEEAVNTTPKDEVLFILPTYSAMLEVRKILSGRKIL